MNRVRKGSGDVFHDLGLPAAELLQAKADLVNRISAIIEKRKLSQAAAAELLGVNQPKVSALLHGRLEGFSMERLVKFLNALDQDVKIVTKPKAGERATVAVA